MTKILKQAALEQLTKNSTAPRIYLRSDLGQRFVGFEICAAKMDLRVGKIFLPAPADKLVRERASIKVPPGGIFIAETAERVELDAVHLGLMSPKSSSLAQNGIFIANIGQVDPGYQGHLNFTCINFSGDDFHLRVGDKIASLMVLELEGESDVSIWHGEPNSAQKIIEGGKLHDQFGGLEANVKRHVRNITMATLLGMSTIAMILTVIVALLIAAVATAVTLSTYKFAEWDARFDERDRVITQKFEELSNQSKSAVTVVEPKEKIPPTDESEQPNVQP